MFPALRVREAPYAKRSEGIAWLRGVDQNLTPFGPETNRRVTEIRNYECVRIACEQMVAGGNQRLYRALVLPQGPDAIHVSLGTQIGVQVRVSETVNRLLGIADHKHTTCAISLSCAPVDPIEYSELQRVRVLELVDQRRRIALTQRRRKRRKAAGSQRIVCVVEDVVVRDLASLAFFQPHSRHGRGKQPTQQP